MQQPLQITFRNMEPSPAIEAAIREKAAKLDALYDRITACHVVVEAPHRRHRQGVLYHVRVDLTVPGEALVVRRDPPEHHAHEDAYVAVRNAFEAVRRQLQDRVRRARGDVKSHEAAGAPAPGTEPTPTADARDAAAEEDAAGPG